MLDKVIATFGALFILLVFAMCSVLFIGMMGQWIAVQDQAHFLAKSQGKYGGYTTEADRTLREFCVNLNLNESVVRQNTHVSAPGAPVPWGTPVTARITNEFDFRLGNFVAFKVPLTGVGWSVSTYLPGTYDVTYTSP